MNEPLPSASGWMRARSHRAPRSRGQRIALAVIAGLAAAALLLIVDGVWAGQAMFRGVASARSALGEGAVAVVTGDPEAARPLFDDAGLDASSTLSAAEHPSVELLTHLPWLGDNVRAVTAVAEASQQSAQAGLSMVEAATILGWQDLRVPATQALGSVDVATLRAATPSLDEVASRLDQATTDLQNADTGRLVGPVATGFDDTLQTLRHRAKIAADARDLAHLLPGLLGAGGSRTYLIAIQTLGVPQGTGGRVDLVGTAVAERGSLSLSGPLTPAGEIYDDVNVTPDGPTAAQELLRAARESGLGELDGVILIDPVWLQDALWVTGSVNIPGRKRPVTMDDAATEMERDLLEGTDPDRASFARADLATAIIESYLDRRPSTEAFAIGLVHDVAERHLIVYSTKPKEQEIVDRLGASGSYVPGPNPLAVTWRSLVTNHAVIFARRTTSQTVTLSADGSAHVRTIVELANQSPEGPPSLVLGLPLPATVPDPGGVDPVGGWAGEVQVALPPKATRITVETSVPSETEVVREEGTQSAVGTLATDPGDQMTLIVSYTIDHAMAKGGGEFRMNVLPQPSFLPATVRVRIDVPTGAVISSASDDLEQSGGSVRYVGTPTRSVPLFVRW